MLKAEGGYLSQQVPLKQRLWTTPLEVLRASFNNCLCHCDLFSIPISMYFRDNPITVTEFTNMAWAVQFIPRWFGNLVYNGHPTLALPEQRIRCSSDFPPPVAGHTTPGICYRLCPWSKLATGAGNVSLNRNGIFRVFKVLASIAISVSTATMPMIHSSTLHMWSSYTTPRVC